MANFSSTEQGPRLNEDQVQTQKMDLKDYRIFFNAGDVFDILDNIDCTGIRFYLTPDAEGNEGLVAVGIDENGKATSDYYQTQQTEPSIIMSEAEAAPIIATSKLNAFFSNFDINQDLSSPHAIGLRISAGKVKIGEDDNLIVADKEGISAENVFETLSMVGVDNRMQDIISVSKGIALSAAPCPPKCPVDPPNG